jgi:hypothetical protein
MRSSMFLSIALLLSGCEVFDPDFDVIHGDVGAFGEPAVTLPSAVAVGQPFRVEVHTVGNGCYSFHSTQIKTDGMLAEIRPFDRVETDAACDDVGNTMDHSVTLRFNQRGFATVRVIGRSGPDRIREVFEYTVRVE